MQAADRSLRSVFVGNIPYDATEEKLRDIFSAVGPVLSFRIVFDRETGKPKGYGFCEYKDQETATSAIRNLNGHDLGGRQLRVDSASNEKARDEPEGPNNGSNEQQMQQHQLQTQTQPVVEPLVDAPTLIDNVLRNLQPEQMFDICKQLKSSLLVNPNETRQLLINNPQLSYALLQTLVMIKAIDAQTAMSTLHKQMMQPAQLQPSMPMMAPMGPPIPGPGMPSSQQSVSSPMMLPSQAIPPSGPMVMQPQVMNSFAFMSSTNPMVATGATAPQPQPVASMQPVGVTIVSSTPSAAPADPRLARQQQQQPPPTGMSEQERQSLFMQVVNMSDQEISLLPPDQQAKIYRLRSDYMSGGLAR